MRETTDDLVAQVRKLRFPACSRRTGFDKPKTATVECIGVETETVEKIMSIKFNGPKRKNRW